MNHPIKKLFELLLNGMSVEFSEDDPSKAPHNVLLEVTHESHPELFDHAQEVFSSDSVIKKCVKRLEETKVRARDNAKSFWKKAALLVPSIEGNTECFFRQDEKGRVYICEKLAPGEEPKEKESAHDGVDASKTSERLREFQETITDPEQKKILEEKIQGILDKNGN